MTDVTAVVAGAGPVGLATAYGLARAGIRVAVLDKEESVASAPRAMAYHYVVHHGFERLGLLPDLLAEGLRGDGMNFIDHQSGEHFHHTLNAIADDDQYPYVLHLGQDQVSRIMLRRLADIPEVEIRYGTEVTSVSAHEEHVDVHATGPGGNETIRCDWLVGADGANSTVRQALGLGFDGFTWPDRFVATNIRYDFESQGMRIANLRIDPTYGAVIAKITQDGLWRFTFRESGDLPLEDLEGRIHEHFATALPGSGDLELVQFAPYRIHQRAADSFRVGRVVLAGDAAHITNPIGGLGLTGGLLDSFVLSEALAAVIDGTADDAVLDAYAEQRKQVFLDVTSPTAIQTKKMVFDQHTPAEREELLAGLRHLSSDREARRAFLLGMRAMVTPSLV